VCVWTAAVQVLYNPDGSEGSGNKSALSVYRVRIGFYRATGEKCIRENGVNLANVCLLGILITLMVSIGQGEVEKIGMTDNKVTQHEDNKQYENC
jgi:hypothetical protein